MSASGTEVLRHTYFRGRSCRPPSVQETVHTAIRVTLAFAVCVASRYSVSHKLKRHTRYMYFRVTICIYLMFASSNMKRTYNLRTQTPFAFMLVYPVSHISASHDPLPALLQTLQCLLQAENTLQTLMGTKSSMKQQMNSLAAHMTE